MSIHQRGMPRDVPRILLLHSKSTRAFSAFAHRLYRHPIHFGQGGIARFKPTARHTEAGNALVTTILSGKYEKSLLGPRFVMSITCPFHS